MSSVVWSSWVRAQDVGVGARLQYLGSTDTRFEYGCVYPVQAVLNGFTTKGACLGEGGVWIKSNEEGRYSGFLLCSPGEKLEEIPSIPLKRTHIQMVPEDLYVKYHTLWTTMRSIANAHGLVGVLACMKQAEQEYMEASFKEAGYW